MTAERPAYDTDATPLDRMARAVVDEADPEQVIPFGSTRNTSPSVIPAKAGIHIRIPFPASVETRGL